MSLEHRIDDYLSLGGVFNPAVRSLLLACRSELTALRALAAERDDLAMRRVLPAINKERAAIRRTALEDAAQICDAYRAELIEDEYIDDVDLAVFDLARLIRALIEKEQK